VPSQYDLLMTADQVRVESSGATAADVTWALWYSPE